jgi:hypothetical protein
MKRFLFAAVALAALSGPVLAADIGIGAGSVGTSAISGGATGVASRAGGASGSLLAGATVSGVRSGQTANSNGMAGAAANCISGPDCVSQAEHQQTSSTDGATRQAGVSLGVAGQVQAGQNRGVAGGVSAGQASANYSYVSIFARP